MKMVDSNKEKITGLLLKGEKNTRQDFIHLVRSSVRNRVKSLHPCDLCSFTGNLHIGTYHHRHDVIKHSF